MSRRRMSPEQERDRRVRLAVFLRGKREEIARKQRGNKVLIRALAAHEDADWQTQLRLVSHLRDNLNAIRHAEYDIMNVLSMAEMTEEEVLT